MGRAPHLLVLEQHAAAAPASAPPAPRLSSRLALLVTLLGRRCRLCGCRGGGFGSLLDGDRVGVERDLLVGLPLLGQVLMQGGHAGRGGGEGKGRGE